MKKFHSLMKRKPLVISLFLMVCFLAVIPLLGTRASESTGRVGEEKVADAATFSDYLKIIGDNPTVTGGRYAGRVWSDKSVYTTDQLTGYQNQTIENDSDFLVAYSTLGSSRVINGETTTPIDMVLMLDISTSMSTSGGNQITRINTLVEQANSLIEQLMELNEENRVGVVVYSGGTATIMPLDHYTKIDGTDYLTLEQVTSNAGQSTAKYWNRLRAQAVNSEGRTINNVNDYFYADSTYLQGALYEGMEILGNESTTTWQDVNGNEENRIPSIIVLSDGGTNVMTKSSGTNATSSNWWNPITGTMPSFGNSGNSQYWPEKDGNPLYIPLNANGSSLIAPRTLATLMTAGYENKKIEENYGTDLQAFAIALDTENLGTQEQIQLGLTLNPREYLTSEATESSAKTAYGTFQTYLSGQTPSLSYSGVYLATYNPVGNVTGTYTLNHAPDGIEDFSSVEELYYIDTYYEAQSDTLENIFNDIYRTLSSTAFHPVSGDDEPSASSTDIIYTDEIGEYMEVKSVKALELFGEVYECDENYTEDVDAEGNPTRTYIFSQKIVKNEAYVLTPDVDLSYITLTVTETTGIYGEKRETVTITIPEVAIPIYCITIDRTIEDGESVVSGYKTNQDSPYAYPLRIWYSVGMQDEYIDEDANQINLSKISEEYKATHTDSSGNVMFYSNYYDGTHLSHDETSTDLMTAGNAIVKFSPSLQNRYYYFQKNRIIYQQASGLNSDGEGILGENGVSVSNPVSKIEDIQDNENYYFVIDYYRPSQTGGTGGEYIEYVVTRTGAELKNSLTTIAQLPDGEHYAIVGNNSGSDVVATAIVGTRLGSLSRFTEQKVAGTTTSIANPTSTAELAYAPVYTQSESENSDSSMTIYLGNNGRISVPNTSLLIGKRVAHELDVIAPTKVFTFELTIDEMAGETRIVQCLIYDEDANNGTGDWVATNEMKEVNFNEDGKATITLQADKAIMLYTLPAEVAYTVTEVTDSMNDNLPLNSSFTLTSITRQDGANDLIDEEIEGNASTTGQIQLPAQGDANGSEVIFTNTYTTLVTQTLEVSKQMEGRTFQSGDSFSFTLASNNGAPLPTNLEGNEVTNIIIDESNGITIGQSISQKVSFGSITYTQPGIYSYLIAEDRPTVDTVISGVSYDTKIYYVSVEVKVTDEGSLEVDSIQTQYRAVDEAGSINWTDLTDYTADSIRFTNTYDADVVTRTLLEYKLLTGKPGGLGAGQFNFTVSASGVHTVTADEVLATGGLLVAPDTANANYSYETKEQPLPDMTTVSNDENGIIEFSPFQFRSWNAGDTAEEQKLGKIYKYTVKEELPEDAVYNDETGEWISNGIVYDQSEKIIYLHIYTQEVMRTEYDESGNEVGTYTELVICADPYGDRGDIFTNAYTGTGELPLTATKIMSGRQLQEGDAFTFSIQGRDGAPQPQDQEGNEITSITITIDKAYAGEFSYDFDLGTLYFTQDDIGNRYIYDVWEANGDLPNMVYATSKRTFTVDIDENGSAILAITAISTDNGVTVMQKNPESDESASVHLEWTNIYSPDSVSLTLTGLKRLENHQINQGDFSFTVSQMNEDGTEVVPGTSHINYVSAGTEVDSEGVSTAEFVILRATETIYEAAGTYYYQVTENHPEVETTIEYDAMIYRIAVTVKDDNGMLMIESVTIEQKATHETTEWEPVVESTVVFNNKYLGEELIPLVITKQVIGVDTSDREYTFILTAEPANETSFENGVMPVIQEMTLTAEDFENAQAQIQFDSLRFIKPGVYTLTVSEKQPTEDGTFEGKPLEGAELIDGKWVYQGMVYDNHMATSTVTVTANEKTGELTVNRTGVTGSMTFINEYLPNLIIQKAQARNEGEATTETLVVEAEDEVTYYLTITNTGEGEAKGITITDEIPDGLTLVEGSISDEGSEENGVITWTLDALAPDESQTVSFKVNVPAVSEWTNWINVGQATYENNPENPEDPDEPLTEIPSNEVEIEEEPQPEPVYPELVLEKAQARNEGEATTETLVVEAEDEVMYYLTITNTGEGEAKGITITDEIPDG
ncbi:MAG: DUF11 domain-containing protein, partial [Turicibacter sp.]|nr:DUF11 domain-containing protein [Turicibacter sp.]